MGQRDIVAIGTSAGGVKALIELVGALPARFPAAVLVTIHLPAHLRSVLDELLSRAGPLPARFARDGDRVEPGHILVAPPDRHLLLDGDRVCLGRGPRENNTRPAIDPMLRSAALCCGPRAIGVVLTGTLGDGASGLRTLAACGGLAVVQDPADAEFPEMPRTALERVKADHVVRLAELPRLLQGLIHSPAGETRPVSDKLRYEVEVARSGQTSMDTMEHLGRRSVLTCPDCGGVMWEFDDDGEPARYRCHVGHAYTAETMSPALDESLRRALAVAQRSLEERVALVEKLARESERDGRGMLAADWRARARDYRREAGIIDGAIRRLDQMKADRLDEPGEPG